MNKTIVITGAGGVLCSAFAKDLAKTGAPVALLDRNLEAAEAVAAEIRAAGGNARAYETDVLDKAALEKTHEAVLRDLGPCRVLLNGAGGNNPRATTDPEIFEPGDELASDMKTFSTSRRRASTSSSASTSWARCCRRRSSRRICSGRRAAASSTSRR